MLSGSLSVGRLFSHAVVCRLVIPPVSVTSIRWKHVKTRNIRGRVKAQHIVTIDSKRFPDVEREAMRLEKEDPKFDWDSVHEDPEDVLSHADKVYDEVAKEESTAKTRIRNTLMKKTENPFPLESNLLWWAAKQQIIYLHRLDPVEWTPDRIAEEFPISAIGAKRLLKSNFLIEEDKIAAHDAEVDLRWKLLRKIYHSGKCPEKGPVSLYKKTIELYVQGKLQNEDFKMGNPEFPRPAAKAGIRVPIVIGQEGEHFRVLQEYKHLLPSGQEEQQNETAQKDKRVLQMPSDMEKLSKSETLGKKLSRDYLNKGDTNDPEAATRLDLPENFKMTFVHEFTGRADIKLDDFKQLQGHEESLAIESNYVQKKLKKKDLQKWAHTESGPQKYKKTRRAAIADERNDDGTYRIGRTVYDDDGEALFRIR